MARTINFDFRIGGGGPLEIPYGFVTIWATKVFDRSPARVLTLETKVAIQNGLATIADVETNGTGPVYEMAYWVQVEDYNCNAQRFLVAVPDGTAPINFLDLKFLDYITGDVLLDIKEWIALYGDLPNRVSTLEGNAGKYPAVATVAALPTASTKAGSAYYVTETKAVYVSDGTKWNVMATMRVDNTVGKRVFVGDGVTEEMVSGDTLWRNITGVLMNGWKVAPGGGVFIRRLGGVVDLRLELLDGTAATSDTLLGFSPGFSPTNSTLYRLRGSVSQGTGTTITVRRYYTQNGALTIVSGIGQAGMSQSITYTTTDPWPTTLPGTAA